MNLKIFLGILFLLLFFNSVFALTVTDIATNIDQGNKEILQSNAQLTATVAQLRTEVTANQQEIRTLEAQNVKKTDLPEIYGTIQDLNKQSATQTLVSVVVVAIASFSFGFISKSRGWL